MTVLNSQLQPGSETFESNRAAMQAVVDDLHATLARTALGGSEAAKWATLWRSRSMSSPRSKFRDGTCIVVAPRRDGREWTHPAGERAAVGRTATRTGDGPSVAGFG